MIGSTSGWWRLLPFWILLASLFFYESFAMLFDEHLVFIDIEEQRSEVDKTIEQIVQLFIIKDQLQL